MAIVYSEKHIYGDTLGLKTTSKHRRPFPAQTSEAKKTTSGGLSVFVKQQTKIEIDAKKIVARRRSED